MSKGASCDRYSGIGSEIGELTAIKVKGQVYTLTSYNSGFTSSLGEKRRLYQASQSFYRSFASTPTSKSSRQKQTEEECHIDLDMEVWLSNDYEFDDAPESGTCPLAEENLLQGKKDISTVEDPFDSPTYHIPEKPVSFTEGASYSVVILAGLGIAGVAAYGVFKELIFEPKEYKIFSKALEKIQHDGQVKGKEPKAKVVEGTNEKDFALTTPKVFQKDHCKYIMWVVRVRIGSPIKGYGQESRNRAARQRIPHRVWTDEDGVEHVEVI
ncbi:putative mitochondrial import inner membrane translocase subunit TIM21 [Bienertia sinuspersici]